MDDNSGLSARGIRILVLEDDESDAELIMNALKNSDHSPAFTVECSASEYERLLKQGEYEVIVADYNLRSWTALDALEILKKSGNDVPFVVVTGSLGDEAAVDCLKHGAADYVLKDRLHRLPLAVDRAIQGKYQREESARLQREIARARDEWELTFDAVPDPILLLDDEFRILRTNRAAATLVGLRETELQGRHCYELMHGQSEPVPGCPYQRMLQSGKEESCNAEVTGLGKVFHATVNPLPSSHGGARQAVHVLHDISHRKKAEDALRMSEERNRDLIENANDIVFTMGLEGEFTSINKAGERVCGYSQEEILTVHFAQFASAEHRDLVQRQIARVITEGSIAPFEVETIARDNHRIVLEVGARLIRREGAPAEIQAIARDITERRQLEEQFRQAQKMEAVGRLAGGIAHDFNNLLTIITGYSDLLQTLFNPEDPARGYNDEIRRAGDRAAALTRQLLAFSRKQVLAPQVIDLGQTVANLEKMLRRVIREDIEFVSVMGADLGKVKADPGQIEQVIMNLAVNARDAMPRGGRLTIETANVQLDDGYVRNHIPSVLPGRYVMLAISDTGVGMDAKTQEHLFEPFFTTKEKGKGTGLGLATVYGIVKQSGGYIWVYSEPGHGTTFKIYLPRVDEAPGDESARTTAEKTPHGQETILLIEDEEPLRKLVRHMLESCGYTVLEASHPKEGLTLCQSHAGQIHLLLTDVIMPGMNGRALSRQVLQLRPQIKVIFMSGYTEQIIAADGVLEPGMAFIQKPYTTETLSCKVREVLDSSPQYCG
jgi:two-component system cell cycle sensor histidine kinase/response regulator CckA